MSKRAVIVGWAIPNFGMLDDPYLESLSSRVCTAVLTILKLRPRMLTQSRSETRSRHSAQATGEDGSTSEAAPWSWRK